MVIGVNGGREKRDHIYNFDVRDVGSASDLLEAAWARSK